MNRQVAVVGGGAAGMMAAICAARAGADVTVYEKNDRVGKKILSTGNGKCNFSNEAMSREAYHGSGVGLAEILLAEFGVAETKQFFEELGMRIKDRDGYLYPASEQASTVLDVLRYEMERLGVGLHTESPVDYIERKRDKIVVRAAAQGEQTFDAVIIACGGKAAPKTGSDGTGFLLARQLGHRIVTTVPALMALRCAGNFWKGVAGVRCDAGITLIADGTVYRERGELQLTEYGISGIPVFQLSREAAYALQEKKHVTAKIDFMADYSEEEYAAFWEKRWNRLSGQTAERFLTGIVNKKINLLLLKEAEIRPSERVEQILQSKRARLAKLYREFTVEITGTNSYEQAQVCAGGVDCLELSENLESLKVPGVFFAGEIVDVDGRCGGYNLQWAWTSGAIAGRSAAGRTG